MARKKKKKLYVASVTIVATIERVDKFASTDKRAQVHFSLNIGVREALKPGDPLYEAIASKALECAWNRRLPSGLHFHKKTKLVARNLYINSPEFRSGVIEVYES